MVVVLCCYVLLVVFVVVRCCSYCVPVPLLLGPFEWWPPPFFPFEVAVLPSLPLKWRGSVSFGGGQDTKVPETPGATREDSTGQGGATLVCSMFILETN